MRRPMSVPIVDSSIHNACPLVGVIGLAWGGGVRVNVSGPSKFTAGGEHEAIPFHGNAHTLFCTRVWIHKGKYTVFLHEGIELCARKTREIDA